MPSRATASVSGFAMGLTNGSRHWVSASIPLAAVTAGGQDTVSSGSTTAARGIIVWLRRLALTRCPGEASTAFAVTSAPVPAVVGTAMHGADGRVIARPAPANSNASTAAYPGPALTAQSSLPAGKIAENLVDARGSAIMSATASR